MGEEALVDSKVTDTAALIRALESHNHRPTMAVWHYFTDANDWRLLIAGPSFDPMLPKDESRAYQVVAEALKQSKPASLWISDVKVLKTDNDLLDVVRTLIRTDPSGVIRAHFQDNTVNGVFLKDILVMRSS